MSVDADRSARFEIAPEWFIPLTLIVVLLVVHMLALGGMQPDTEDKGRLCLGIAGYVLPRDSFWYFSSGIFAFQSVALLSLFAARRRYWTLAVPIFVAPL